MIEIDTTNMCSHLQKKLFEPDGVYYPIFQAIQQDDTLMAVVRSRQLHIYRNGKKILILAGKAQPKIIREDKLNALFPRRYKVRPRIYFIIIKTTAQTMQDFKEKKALRPVGDGMNRRDLAASASNRLGEFKPGWYEGELDFKRVVLIPATNKHEYRDTHFVARVKANSGQDCYNRIVDHLRGLVDPRSQFPSAKGKNFKYKYLGLWK